MSDTSQTIPVVESPKKLSLLSYLSNYWFFVILIIVCLIYFVYLINGNYPKCCNNCLTKNNEVDLVSNKTSQNNYANNLNYATEPENESKVISIKDDVISIKIEGNKEIDNKSIIKNEDLHKKELIEYYKSGSKKGQVKKPRKKRISKKDVKLEIQDEEEVEVELEEVQNEVELEE